MTQLIKGMIIGSAITAAAMAGYAFGNAGSPRGQQDPTEINELERGNCDVQVGFGRYTVGDQCRFDQVMVGARDGYLLCADLEVTCPNR